MPSTTPAVPASPNLASSAAGLALLCGLMTITPAARALPLAIAEIEVDWSSLQFTPLSVAGGPVPVLTWSQRSSVVDGGGAPLTVADWTTPLSRTNPFGPDAHSLSQVDANRLHAYSEDSGEDSVNTAIWTQREGQFTVQGSGELRVTVSTHWASTLLPPNAEPFLHFTTAGARISAETRYDPRGNSNRLGEDSFSAQKSSNFGDSGSWQGDYTLSFTVEVQDGDLFYFTAHAGTVASIIAVPMPPSAWLLALGLPGVLGAVRWQRRRRPVSAA